MLEPGQRQHFFGKSRDCFGICNETFGNIKRSKWKFIRFYTFTSEQFASTLSFLSNDISN